jgi:hypothetical protein
MSLDSKYGISETKDTLSNGELMSLEAVPLVNIYLSNGEFQRLA